MASITLTSKEYQELLAKAALADQITDIITDGYKVEMSNSSWRPISVNFQPAWPEELAMRIAQTVGKKLSMMPTAMEYIAEEDEYVFDLEECQMCDMPYNKRLYAGQYNLLEICEDFSTEYEGCKIERELALEKERTEDTNTETEDKEEA
jgi:hypothetical protein